MDVISRSTAGQGFGVAGFVLGLIALIISFIPCLGMYAVLPGIVALVFSIIAFSQANRGNAPKGLIIAALIISIISTSVASWQMMIIRRASEGLGKFGTEIHETIRRDIGDEIRENIRKALELEDLEELKDPGMVQDDTLIFDSEEMIEELERLEGEQKDN